MRWASAGRGLWCVAVVAMANVALVGCARSWPTVNGVADRDFASRQRVVDTVDVMPKDIDFAVSSHAKAPAQEIMDRFQSVALGTVQAELQRRGYQLTAVMSWDGGYTAPDGKPGYAIEQEAVVDTADSLRGYGYAQSKSGQRGLLRPYLPHRLGTATGADTTLYIGGYAYVGKKRTSTGKKVAIGVLIGAVVVVVIIAAVAGSKKGGGVGGLFKGAGKVAGHGAKTIVRGAGTAAKTMGKMATSTGKVIAKTTPRVLEATARATGRATVRMLDAFGRSNVDTHIEIYGGEPGYYQRDIPRKGYSRMDIEMTLVDNDSGRVLWHARQQFEADAQSGKDTARVMQLMLASLPATR